MAYSNSEVAHVWANQLKKSAKGSNLFFEGERIYSYGYHFTLGILYPEKNTVILNKTNYSVTTSRHQSIVRSASRQYKQIWAFNPDSPMSEATTIIRMLQNLKDDYKAKIKKARVIAEMHSILSNFKEFIELVDFKLLEVHKQDLSEIEAFLNSNEVKERLRLEAEREKKRLERKALEEKNKYQIERDRFLSHKVNRIYSHGQYDLLRISQDGSRVETSQGIQIPVPVAKLSFQMLKTVPPERLPGKNIGPYQIISLDNGVLKIGCHKILMTDIEKIGNHINNTPA